MQAVILSGGQGTRLRPLTSTMPKPAVPLVNRPMISYMVDWLAGHGVRDVIMSVGFLADGLRAALDDAGHDGVTIRYVEESKPLGTAGAVKQAEQFLDERFVVINGDVLSEFDLSAEIEQHSASGAQATLALVPVPVEEATAYGLVLTGDDNRIEAFLEKPDSADVPAKPRINAGAYVLERAVFDMIPADENRSFEHDVFPLLARETIRAFDADGYWLDLGTPERYMTATRDLLDGKLQSWLTPRLMAGGAVIEAGVETAGIDLEPPLIIDGGSVIGAGTKISRHSVIGHGCEIGNNCTLDHAVIQRGSTIGSDTSISNTIIGPGTQIGDGVTIESGTVIGEGARVANGATIPADARIEAGADVPAN